MHRLGVLSFALPALLIACGAGVVVDDDADRSGGTAGSSAGGTNTADLGSVCLQNCAVWDAACAPGVNDCGQLCAKIVGVAGQSEACATASSALVVCLSNPQHQEEQQDDCMSLCDDAAQGFSACYQAWCAADPAPAPCAP